MDENKFYDRVGSQIGWDFGDLKCSSEGESWDFYDEVVKAGNKTNTLLDIGTGSGEKILNIAQYFSLLVGIDSSENMINKAQTNLAESGISNTKFYVMDSANIRFPDGFFDIISCRHSPFYAEEVSRLLADNGIFLTQQVSEEDKLNIKQAFGRGQNFGKQDGRLKETYIKELHKAGLTDIQSLDYDAVEYFQTPEDLEFLLKNTPTIPDFGENEADYAILSKFIAQNTTAKGIITNSKRFMIIAKRPLGIKH